MSEALSLGVRTVAAHLDLALCAGEAGLDRVVGGAQVGDLLSHVMAQGRHGQLWVTIQTHPNIIAVAALAGLSGIVIAAGFEPDADAVARADEEGIPLFTSGASAFTIAGRLYELGVR